MNPDVIVLPTCRESDGLAMSSRNTYLNTQERQAATVLFRALTHAENLYKNGQKDADLIRNEMLSLINQEQLAQVEYVSIADKHTLNELNELTSSALVSLAVRIGKTRLIDNIILK